MNSKLLISILALTAVSMPAMAEESSINFSYGDEEIDNWGLKVSQTYDIAIDLTDPAFVGAKLTKISVPVTVTDQTSDYKVWLSSTLKLETIDGKKVNVADIMSADVEPGLIEGTLGLLEYTLPEPYEITDAPLYVGYSMTVNKIDSDYDRYPILVCLGTNEKGFYVHSSKTYRQWSSRSEEAGVVSAIVVELTGDFYADAASLGEAPLAYGTSNEEASVKYTVINHGSNEISNVGYQLTIGDNVTDGTYEFKTPILNKLNATGTIEVKFPALEAGTYAYELALTKVNGEDNLDPNATIKGEITYFDVLPIKRPLMEEFTGTWCGWCPRGWVAMEKMNELHPDFVGIAYHNGDAMQLENGYPNMVSGFPGAYIDRRLEVDPYYGTGNQEFGIEPLWESICEEFAPAEINLTATYDEESNAVKVESEVIWALNPGSGDYRIEYVLVGDGLQSEDWTQSNYYYQYSADAAGIYMENFCEGGIWGTSKVPMLVFNDVALLNTGAYGVKGSIESTEANSVNTYTHVFNLDDNALTAAAEKLRVVAMVLKAGSGYGLVLNANKTDVTGDAKINSIVTDANVVSIKYYDLSGREVKNPANGLFIQSVKFDNGEVVNNKIMRR